MVDEHARQPVSDGSLDQRRCDRGVHAAGQSADGPAVTDLRADLFDEGVGDVGRRPRRIDAGELVQEPAEHLLAMRTVHDLGVVLDTGQPTRPILKRSDRSTGTGGDDVESGGSLGDGVTVAHPHRLPVRQIRMQFSADDIQLGAAEFTGAGVRDGAAQCLGHRLEAVADPEHRDVEIEQRRVELRRAVGVHAGRPAGQDDCARVARLDLIDGRGVRDDFGEHPRLPHPPCDELGVLGTEIDHQHRAGSSRIHPNSLVGRLGGQAPCASAVVGSRRLTVSALTPQSSAAGAPAGTTGRAGSMGSSRR